ncbi:hypothetical protein Dimus_003242, partial [Dionaea muscipula]
KEKLTWGKLGEIKSYVEAISEELTRTTFMLKKNLFDIADLIKGKIKDHSTLIELKVEESRKDLQYLKKQKFTEQDIRLKGIEDTLKD